MQEERKENYFHSVIPRFFLGIQIHICNVSMSGTERSSLELPPPPPAPLLKGGGGRTFEKLSNMGGDTIFFARKEGSTCKLGVDAEMAGCHFFSYFKIQSYLLCVCVGKVRFPLLLFGSSAF